MKAAILVAVAVLFSTPLRAQTCAGPLDLGTLGGPTAHASDVSEDGRVVVGVAALAHGGGDRAFRWTAAGGMQDLGTLGGVISSAYGVSADGSTVVGGAFFPPYQNLAFRWTAAGGMQDLGTLGGAFAYANAASADGSVVVGNSDIANSFDNHAFRWTAAGGMQDLGTLGGAGPTAYISSGASGVSADGSVVVGSSRLATGDTHAFRWTASSGMQDLGTLGGTYSGASGVSADGSVVVGSSSLANGDIHPFRWTAAGGMQDIDTLGGRDSFATCVSADGSVVAGRAYPVGACCSYNAYRWTASSGMQILGTLGSGDSGASGVSADGSVVVGDFRPTNGVSRTFRVQSSILGASYCRPTVANSAGCGGIVLAEGDPRAATGALELTVALLPPNAAGYFLASQTQGQVANARGSQGSLCLGGSIGRFTGHGQVMNSGAFGTFTLVVDLNAVPTPTGWVAVQPGETWNFQAWHRDASPTLTSNFTDAVSLTFE